MRPFPKFIVPCLLGATLLVGCSSNEENPITPDRMNEIRKKEADERANFNPQSGPPPSVSKTGG